MKKINFLIIIMFLLSSCKEKKDDFQKAEEFLIKNNVAFLEYKDNSLKLKDKFDSYKRVDSLDEVLGDYQVYIFTNRIYDEIKIETIEKMIEILKNKKTSLFIFVNFTDYNFFKDTDFKNDKNFYPANSKYSVYYTRSNKIENINYDFEFDEKENYRTGVILSSYNVLMEILNAL